MIFWTLLLVSLFVMVILYLMIGYQRVWLTILVYVLLSVLASFIIYHVFPGLYRLDLFALFIPMLILFPIHMMIKSILNHYVLPSDEATSRYFVGLYNRILNILGLVLIALIVGILMSVIDILIDTLKAENIWSLAVTSSITLVVLYGLISIGYKKQFSIILVVGAKTKRVYKMTSHKARIKVYDVLNQNILVKPRGIYQEAGELHYLYYVEDELAMDQTPFKKHQSKMYEFIKKGIESFEGVEQAYNEFIEQIQVQD